MKCSGHVDVCWKISWKNSNEKVQKNRMRTLYTVNTITVSVSHWNVWKWFHLKSGRKFVSSRLNRPVNLLECIGRWTRNLAAIAMEPKSNHCKQKQFVTSNDSLTKRYTLSEFRRISCLQWTNLPPRRLTNLSAPFLLHVRNRIEFDPVVARHPVVVLKLELWLTGWLAGASVTHETRNHTFQPLERNMYMVSMGYI